MEIALNIPAKEKKIVSNGVLGMLLVLTTEAMFFAGLISAYIVNRAGAAVWPPPDQPRLPIEITAVNTLVLLASGVAIYLFGRKFRSAEIAGNGKTGLLITTLILGTTFLAIQGTEWVKLIGYGLTTHSGIYGAFFYTLIGMHGFHVLVGLTILLYLFFKLRKEEDKQTAKNLITIASMYWYFVVAIWPILYILVYLQ